MKRATLIVSAVALGFLLYMGATYMQQLSGTRERRAADTSAAIEAVATRNPDIPRSGISADFWNPTDDALATIQVTCAGGSPPAYDVTVRWEPTAGHSKAVSMEPNHRPK